MSDTIIVIPARYGSTRFPGKPLSMIAGKTLLQHVCGAATKAAQQLSNVTVLVATDDDRIMQHANSINIKAVLTPRNCATGTDRIYAAMQTLDHKPRNVINLQGDAPLTPPAVIIALIKALEHNNVVTPITQLSWQDLDRLRQSKLKHPFSGTTVIINSYYEAMWFSKNIIPAIRNETELRETNAISPVFQHLGIYGYTYEMLATFTNMPEGKYEQLEGLEQLRLLENGYKIKTVLADSENLHCWSGVDTPADAELVAKLLNGNI
jgi:3-deoxy-manno-octulosonate cytidylyltransferase (CMP-KDO synthetase)